MIESAAKIRESPGADRYRIVRKVTLVGAVVDLALGVVKLSVGWTAHSQALIADGVHSLSDLSTDLLIVYAAKHSHREADADHPYGHGRIETVATMVLAGALVLVGIGISYDAVHRLFHPERLLRPELAALVVAAFSVVSKELVYRYTIHHARQLRSAMLRANAWHSRSDAFSSVAVIVGVVGTMAGLTYVDAIAAIVVAVMVSKIGWNLGWSSLRELVDTGLEPEQLADVKQTILSVDGVKTTHLLRTRQMGGRTLVDVHLLLDDPMLSVSEGHQISETVRASLLRSDDDIMDVTVHIDPEDDEHSIPNRHLPLRAELIERFSKYWQGLDGAGQIQGVTIHYLAGRVDVDIDLPVALAASQERVKARANAFAEALQQDSVVGRVRMRYS